MEDSLIVLPSIVIHGTRFDVQRHCLSKEWSRILMSSTASVASFYQIIGIFHISHNLTGVRCSVTLTR